MNGVELTPTADPHVGIEEQRPGYVRYRNRDGRRWEVHGLSGDMPPASAQDDVLDRRMRDAVVHCQSPIRSASLGVPLADLDDLGFGQTGMARLLTSGSLARQYVPPASPVPSVLQVVGLGSYQQVIRSRAGRIIATVPYNGSGGERTLGPLGDEAVDVEQPSLAANLSVAGRVLGSGPDPAFAGPVEMFPDPVFHAGKCTV